MTVLERNVRAKRRAKRQKREDIRRKEIEIRVGLMNSRDDVKKGRHGKRRKGKHIPVTVKERLKPVDPSLIIGYGSGEIVLPRKSLKRQERDPENPTTPFGKKRKRFSMSALYAALNRVECDADKVPIMEHFVRRAYDSDQVLKDLMGKILPDLKSIDAKISQKSPYKLILDVSQPVKRIEAGE